MISNQPNHNRSQLLPEISREEILSRLRDPSLVLLNVLPREAFAGEHILGSISLPVAEINERAVNVLTNILQEIVVYCANAT